MSTPHDPVPPAQHQPPGPGRRPDPQPTPPDPEALSRAGRVLRQFGVWLIAAVLVTLLPMPWRLATLVFVVGALVTGVRGVRVASAGRLRGGLVPMMVVGMVMAGVLAASTLGSIPLWPAERAYDDCRANAVTLSAQHRCDRQYQEDQQEVLDRLLGQLSPGG